MKVCDCIHRPGTMRDGRNCLACGFVQEPRRWDLTPEAMAAFFTAVGEAAPDIQKSGHLSHFGSLAMERAFGMGADAYKLNGFIERPMEGEAEAELLDAGNYQIFEALYDLYRVDHGQLDPIVCEEDYRTLLALTVDIIRAYARIEDFHRERRARTA